jgi:sugar phosphate isomerase/epimerase
MQIGILTNSFATTRPNATVDAVRRHNLTHVQLELVSVGLAAMPDQLDRETAARIRNAFARGGVMIAAVSGTFNMIHPDANQRRIGLTRLETLAATCHDLGTSTITLCTGTRDPDNMWRKHPDSNTDAAWRDLVASMREAARIGEAYGVTMAFEPEVNNCVDSPRKARRLLDEIGSPRLKVVMDGANIFHTGELSRMREVLTEAFELLGNDIALAHAKDLDHDGDAGHLPAGLGLLDYELYLSLLKRAGFDGALILHGLSEAEVDGCVAFLRSHLSR